jgi:hypothetical protein
VDNDTISLNDGEPLQEEEYTSEDPQQAAALPDFPEEAFTGLFKSYLDLVGPCTEAPAPYHWVTFLTMTGLLLGRKLSIAHPLPLYPNFYSLLIGTTGLNRKSTALNFGRRELLNKIQNDIVVVTGALSSEGIYEKLVKTDTRLLLYCDEMRSFLKIANRQATSDIIPRLNSLFGCPDDDDLTRRHDSITAIRPFVSFIAGTPKEWLTDAIGTGEIMGGFVNRFLLVAGVIEKSIAFPEPPNKDAAKRLLGKLNQIIDQCANEPVEMTWSGEARTIYERFYNTWHHRQRSRPDSTAAITNRISDHIVKIGMVYSIQGGHTEMTDDAIATAIKIGDYLERTAIAIFGDTSMSVQGRIEHMIVTRLENNNNTMALRDLRLAIGGKADTTQFNQALLNLDKADIIRVVPPLNDTKSKMTRMVFLLRG